MSQLKIILTRPQLAENIGAIARVMGNFDLAPTSADSISALRVVNPQVEITDPKSVAMAVVSSDILHKAQLFQTLEEATFDCKTLIGTTAIPRQLIKHYFTPKTLAETYASLPSPIALIFGPERTGLHNDEIALCHHIVQIPVSEERSSLNLSHAAGILLYELFLEKNTENPKTFWQKGETEVANAQDVDSFLRFLEEKLDHSHFWRTPCKKQGMKRNLIGLFKRQHWFVQDLKTLRGMVDALLKTSI